MKITSLQTKSSTPIKILKYLRENGKSCIREVSRGTKLHPSVVSYWTTGQNNWKKPGMLVDMGIVRVHKRKGVTELYIGKR